MFLSIELRVFMQKKKKWHLVEMIFWDGGKKKSLVDQLL